MNVLEFTAAGNHLEITEDAVTTGGSVNYDKCSFTFDEEWEDFEKTAVFLRAFSGWFLRLRGSRAALSFRF